MIISLFKNCENGLSEDRSTKFWAKLFFSLSGRRLEIKDAWGWYFNIQYCVFMWSIEVVVGK